MQKALINELKLKSGNSYPVGYVFQVTVPEDQPTIALLNDGFQEVKIRSISLHKYFLGFKKPTPKMLMGEFDSAICPSLTGERIEPDGWDSKGFPSMLLALGYI